MSTPSAAQIDTLLNFLEEHRELARGNLRSVEGRVLSHRLWEEICTTLNAIGGCTKTTKQWQKVWTDKKYLAKKAAVAARRSASVTGGGPSTVSPLSQWEQKVILIMGDGFGEPQTTARVPAFVEVTQETSAAASTQVWQENLPQSTDNLQITEGPYTQLGTNIQPSTSAAPATHGGDTPVTHTTTIRTRQQRRSTYQADSSVRDRLFELEEQRIQREGQRNEELAGIKLAIIELCRLMQLLIEQLQIINQ